MAVRSIVVKEMYDLDVPDDDSFDDCHGLKLLK